MRQCVVGRWRICGVCAIRSLVNARRLQLECTKVLHESLLVPVFTYNRDTAIWREEERARIRTVQMDNFIGLLGIRRMDKVPNPRIRQLHSDEGRGRNDDEGILRWFGHVERIENDKIAKRVYVG